MTRPPASFAPLPNHSFPLITPHTVQPIPTSTPTSVGFPHPRSQVSSELPSPVGPSGLGARLTPLPPPPLSFFCTFRTGARILFQLSHLPDSRPPLFQRQLHLRQPSLLFLARALVRAKGIAALSPESCIGLLRLPRVQICFPSVGCVFLQLEVFIYFFFFCSRGDRGIFLVLFKRSGCSRRAFSFIFPSPLRR